MKPFLESVGPGNLPVVVLIPFSMIATFRSATYTLMDVLVDHDNVQRSSTRHTNWVHVWDNWETHGGGTVIAAQMEMDKEREPPGEDSWECHWAAYIYQ